MLPPNHRGLLRHTLVLSQLCKDEEAASRLTYTVLDLWFAKPYPQLLTHQGCKVFAENPAVAEFADKLAQLPFIEAAFWLSCGYANWVGRAVRKARAMFFTPPRLAEQVIDNLIAKGASLRSDRWFDPACGGAAFIVPLAIRMRAHLQKLGYSPEDILSSIEKNIVGIDIDHTLQALATVYVKAVVYDETEVVGRAVHPCISCANTLAEDVDSLPAFSVLLCNPPYRKLIAADRETIFPEHLSEVEGQHNLYAVFMAVATKAAKEDALIALLTPTSYMSGRHFSKLRRLLMTSLDIVQLDLLNDRDSTFVEVEQETVVLYGKRVKVPTQRRTPVRLLADSGPGQLIGEVSLSGSGDVWFVPRNAKELGAFESAAKLRFRLQDYGYVPKIGPLVWNRDSRRQLFSLDEVRSAKSPVPVIWSSSITADGRFEFERNSAQNGYFSFVDFEDGSSEGLIRQSCVVLQRVTSTDQTRRLVAAVIPEDFLAKHKHFVAENHVITLIPVLPKISPAEMKVLLMSEEVDLLYRCMSGTVGVTVFELKQLPLPSPAHFKNALRDFESQEVAVTLAYKKSIDDREDLHGT